eukprot:scaffold14951_cov60-Phaeocystis_antarctica.AAC.5
MAILAPVVWRRPRACERGDFALSKVDLAGNVDRLRRGFRLRGGAHEAHDYVGGLVEAAAGQRDDLLARDAVAEERRVHRLQRVAGNTRRTRDQPICRWVTGKFEWQSLTTHGWQCLQQVGALGHGLAPLDGCIYDRQGELAAFVAARLQLGMCAVLKTEHNVSLQWRKASELARGRRSGLHTLDRKRSGRHGGEEQEEDDDARHHSRLRMHPVSACESGRTTLLNLMINVC